METPSIQDGQRFEVVLIGDYGVGKTSLIGRINGNKIFAEATLHDLVNVEYRTLTQNLVVRFHDTGGLESGVGHYIPTNLFR